MSFTPQERREYIGGSDVGDILGLGRREPIEVALEKKGLLDPFEGNEWTEVGECLEGGILDLYSLRTGRKHTKSRKNHRHPKWSFLRGHLDATAHEGERIIDAKHVTWNRWDTELGRKEWGEPGLCENPQNRVPHSYLMQGVHYLSLRPQSKWFDLAALIEGQMKVYEIPREAVADKVESLPGILAEWWETYVVGDEIPRGVSPGLTQRLYPEAAQGTIYEVSGAEVDLFRRLYEARKVFSDAEKAKKLLEEECKMILGDHETAQHPELGILATWGTEERTTLRSKDMREHIPKTWERWAQTIKTRPFRFKDRAFDKEND